MKAEELRELIREVLAEQENQMKLQTGSKTPQALKAEILDTIKNIDVEKIKSQELMFLNQMIGKMFELAATGDLVRGRQAIQRAFGVMSKGVPKEEPQQTNEGYEQQMMPGGIEDDDHEVHMALSDLHKLEEYAPKVSQLASQYSDLPGWVQAKITLAADYLGKVYHYLDGKHNKGME
jgi:phage-related minor tail protein